MKTVLWFEEISKEDVAQVGGKGANLGEMYRAGFPIPPGFCLTSFAYFSFLEETKTKEKIINLLKDLDIEDSSKLQKIAQKIQQLILKAKMPSKIASEIKKNYRRLSGQKDVYVAVRSSATAEDLPEASFAGQQASFLNVLGEKALLEAVQKCWASLFEARAIYYRQTKGFDHFKVGLAVVIQKMVQADVSGIMFTVDPVTNDRHKIVIEAGYGLGEAIVSGSVTPDRYLVLKDDFSILNKEVASQEWKIVLQKGKNKKVMVLENEREKQKLDDLKIIKIAQIGENIEKHYHFPQDIEWAVEKGEIFIVQSRPVTTLKTARRTKTSQVSLQQAKVILKGAGASVGLASGPVRIIHSPREIDQVKEGDVLVTEMTTPDYVPAMKRAAAIVTDQGGRTCHAAIVSRELGIPCVVGTGQATKVLKNNQLISVDGKKGLIYEGAVKEATKKKESFILKPSYSAPVTATKIYVNLGEPELAEKVAQMAVDGVGLLRAEFMISEIGIHPRKLIQEAKSQLFVDKLAEGLMIFAAAFYPRPVVYRATDFKTNEYRHLKGGEEFEPQEENPMIGYRGCFRYIKEPDLFNLELEAIKKVRQNYRNLHLMIPFVRTVEEFQAVKKLVEASDLFKERDFKFWIMAEVPSVYFFIDQYCQMGIDGISIGSNDLTQLTLGLDRDNERLEELFDERNEAVLASIKHLIEVCKQYNVTSSICGQAPSVYPELTEKLVEWGITSISVNPDVVEETRRLVASVEEKLLMKKIEEIEEIEKKIKGALEKK